MTTALAAARAWAAGLVVWLGTAASAYPEPQQHQPTPDTTVTDDRGHRFATDKPVQRVVTLAPHLTELVFAAGGGARLVGVSRYSDYPAAAQRLPRVGDAFAVNLEVIVASRPDLVLVWSSGLGERQRARLVSLGLPVFESEIRDIAGMGDTLHRLGLLLGTTATADAAAAALQARWSALQGRYGDRGPVRVFYQVSSSPLMTVNGEQLVSKAITACGGVNVFAAQKALVPTVSWEAAARADPELIVMSGDSAQPDAASLGRWPSLPGVEAVAKHRIVSLPGDLLGRMGPRFVDGAEQLCGAIDAVRIGKASGR